MFTGIIKKTSNLKNTKSKNDSFEIEILNNLGKVKLGESISINGVCSTVKKIGKDIAFEYMPETLKLSNIGLLKKGEKVNIEQSMRLNDRLDGHIVLGHIDGKGKILKITKEGNSRVFEIKIPDKKFAKFLVYKGSVAMEGISLTVAKVFKDFFVVKVIPYTFENTNLNSKKVGDLINLEFDILAKYANKK
ncbi:MAG: riboflavin synthase [Candidatus Pacebacteria bacterium]|nr:riboflavin synthase [Candidatus Paceibacterota bacterium]